MFINSETTTSMKKILQYILLLLITAPVTLFAQINITTTVSGPFIPYQDIQAIKEETTVNVTAVDGGDIQYMMTLASDANGIGMSSSLYMEGSYPGIMLGANGDLDDLFDKRRLNFTNTYSGDAFDYGLPAGVYQLCIKAGFYRENPTGDVATGCFTFVIPVRTVSLNVSLSAPNNVPFGELSSKALVTLMANANIEDVFLSMLLTGDNGISIQTRPTVRDNISLMANVPIVLTGAGLDALFEQSNLQFSGITATTAMEQGLPTGNYSMCFRLWYDYGEPATNEPPSGCFSFTVTPPSMVVSTVVMPPNIPDLMNLAEKTMVTIQSNSAVNGSLTLLIEGNNGIEISTLPAYKPTADIDLMAGVPYIVSQGELMDYLELNTLVIKGIAPKALYNNGLPEGMYRVCIGFKDLNGTLLTQGFPSGCSNYFSLLNLEPPQLISPVCGNEVISPGVQNIVFNWTPPPGAPIHTEYILKIVELVSNKLSPADALLSSYPPLFEEAVNGTSYFYGPAETPMENGKRYAWQVTARDEETKVQFKNQGRSQACSFIYKTSLPSLTTDHHDFFGTTDLSALSNVKPADKEFLKTIPFATVKGRMNYKFYDPLSFFNEPEQITIPVGGGQQTIDHIPGQQGDKQQTSKPGQTAKQSNHENFSQKGVDFTSVNSLMDNMSNTVNLKTDLEQNQIYFPEKKTDHTIYTSGYISPSKSETLGGVKLSLKQYYLIEDGEFLGEHVDKLFLTPDNIPPYASAVQENYMPGMGQTIATTTTNPDGSFEFTFVHTDETGLIDDNFDVMFLHMTSAYQKPEEKRIKGMLHKVLRVIVESPYYYSPDVNIKVQPEQTVDAGNLVSYVNSYSLGVNVFSAQSITNQAAGQGKPMEGVNATLTRKDPRHKDIPEDESQAKKNKNKKVETSFGKVPVLDESVTNAQGKVYYNRLVVPANNADRYYIWVTTDDKKGNYTYKSTYKIAFDYPQQKGLFNSQVEIKNHTLNIYMVPNNPRIFGRVQDAVYNKPLPGSVVTLESRFNSEPQGTGLDVLTGIITGGGQSTYIYKTFKNADNDGYFEFNNLPVEENNAGALTGPKRKLWVTNQGYNPYYNPNPLSKEGFIMAKGFQMNLVSEIKLQPKGLVTGYVTDEKGNPVKARIRTPQGSEVSTKTVLSIGGVTGPEVEFITREKFEVYLPSGQQKVTVKPLNPNAYSTEEYTLNVQSNVNTQLTDPLKVYTLKHRMRIKVSGSMQNILIGVDGVKVHILDTVVITKNGGWAEYEFTNLANQFEVRMVPPDNLPFYEKTVTLSNTSSKYYTSYFEILPEAAIIKGRVTIGANMQPVDNARVFVENGSNAPPNQAFTGSTGLYTLKVPLYPQSNGQLGLIEDAIMEAFQVFSTAKESEKQVSHSIQEFQIPESANTQYVNIATAQQVNYYLRLYAVKSSQENTIVGDYKTIGIPPSDSVNFNLTIYSNMNITELYGIPIEITALNEKSATTVSVKGCFIVPDNESIAFNDGNNRMNFDWVNLKASKNLDPQKIPYAMPDASFVQTTRPSATVKIQSALKGDAMPATGAAFRVEPDKNLKGSVTGKIRLHKETFEISEGTLGGGFPENIYLGNINATSNVVTIFKARHLIVPLKARYSLMNQQGNDLSFTLYGFDVKANRKNSFLQNGELNLDIAIKYTLPLSDNTDLPLGNLVVTSKTVKTLIGNKAIKIPLGKWELHFDKWNFSSSSNGLWTPQGIIKTGGIDIPVKGILLKNNDLSIESAVLQNFMLSNVAPLTINNSNVHFNFGFDPGVNQWSVSIIGKNGNPAATLGGLPGMKATDKLTFQSVEMLSNGEHLIGFGMGTQPIVLFDVFEYSPFSISVYNSFFQVAGSVNLGIPKLSTGYIGLITYSKPGADIVNDLKPIPFSFEGQGNVQFIAGNKQTLDINGYVAEGVVTEADLFKLNATLTRKKNAITSVDVIAGQYLDINKQSKSKLVNVTGDMKVNNTNTDWGYFSFAGDMEGAKGITDTKKRLDFTVYGAVEASGQELSVKNMDLPFGNISITYDFKESRLHGSLLVKDKDFGGLGIKQATFELLFDKDGWYFLGGGDFKVNEPVGNIKSGIVIGDYKAFTPLMQQSVMEYAYNKTIPVPLMGGFSGFFFTGQKYIETGIPDYDIPLLVGSVKFGAKAGLDARFWMNFDDGLVFGFGAMAYARAWFYATSWFCTSLDFCLVGEMGAEGWFNASNGAFDLTGCGSIGLAAKVSQCTGASIMGVDACIDPCLNIDISESLKIELGISSGKGLTYNLGWGSCSSNPVTAGNCD